MPIRTSEDIVIVRQAVRRKAVALGFGLVDQTKMVTASSELARNTLDYGGGGTAQLERWKTGRGRACALTFEDRAPALPISILPSRTATPREMAWGWVWAAPSGSPTNSRSGRNRVKERESPS